MGKPGDSLAQKEGNQEEPQTEGKPWFPCGSVAGVPKRPKGQVNFGKKSEFCQT